MTLEVIVTTMNKNLLTLLKKFYSPEEDVIFQISHQITDQEENDYLSAVKDFLTQRPDVTYHYYFEKGLSRNRNRSMEHSRGDLVLVTDDDIEFKPGAFMKVTEAFKKIPLADIITFKTEFPDGNRYKKYRSGIVKHTPRSSLRVSSFEIAYKRKSIEDMALQWDEDFGLGGNLFTNGMENIFILDAMKLKLKCYFYPETIVIHPFENSGYDYSEYLVTSKGAVFARMFGKTAYLMNFVYAVKKFQDYKDRISFLNFIRLSFKGTKEFLKQEN